MPDPISDPTDPDAGYLKMTPMSFILLPDTSVLAQGARVMVTV